MGSREQVTFGELTLTGASNGSVKVLIRDSAQDILFCTGTTKPTDATDGFAKGCLFIDTDITTGNPSLYENIGTSSSCVFNLIGAISEGEISVASGKILVGQGSGVAAAKTPSGVVSMTTDGVFSLTSSGSPFANAIADPGNGAAIPVTASGHVAITTGGSGQTNTLAAPSAVGMLLALTLDVDGGGDRVITCATTVNQTGDNTITLADAGDTILLYSVQIGGNKRWRVAANDGAVLSTV